MPTFKATICGGPNHGQAFQLTEAVAGFIVPESDASQPHRLACRDGEELLYMHPGTRLPRTLKVVPSDDADAIEAITQDLCAQATQKLRLPGPWRWGVTSEPVGKGRVLLRVISVTQAQGARAARVVCA
jgi:hypothetical protein